MGRDWPQLRGPLAIALLASSVLDYPDPLALFSARRLLPDQSERTVVTAEKLHRHYRINAHAMSTEMAQLEWHRALSAATYITFKLLSDHPHERYDPYHDYVREADTTGLLGVLQENSVSFKNAGEDFVALYKILTQEKQLAALFRASYMPYDRRQEWWQLNRDLPNLCAIQDFHESLDPRECRKAVVRRLNEKMLLSLKAVNPKARMAAAMGIDWKLLDDGHHAAPQESSFS